MKTYSFDTTIVNVYSQSELAEELQMFEQKSFYPSLMEFAESIDYTIVIHPFGDECTIDANVSNNIIDIVFDRDIYKFEFNEKGLETIARMSEIYFNTEDIVEIRNFLSSNN